MKHAGGRPTKYKEELIDKVDEYLALCGREQTRLPKQSEYYRYIGINVDTGNKWCKKYPKFNEAIKRIDQAQKEELIDDGLYGGREINQAMAIFLLKVNHGMVETEKRQVDITTGGEKLVIYKPAKNPEK